jgi:flagellin
MTMLEVVEYASRTIIGAAATFGVHHRSLETRRDFAIRLENGLRSGISSMIDSDMEIEAARMEAIRVQQSLATQALSIANETPKALLNLFR